MNKAPGSVLGSRATSFVFSDAASNGRPSASGSRNRRLVFDTHVGQAEPHGGQAKSGRFSAGRSRRGTHRTARRRPIEPRDDRLHDAVAEARAARTRKLDPANPPLPSAPHRAGLIRIHEPLDLPLEPPLRCLEAGPIPRPLGGPFSARSPGLDLLLEHRRGLDPRRVNQERLIGRLRARGPRARSRRRRGRALRCRR